LETWMVALIFFVVFWSLMIMVKPFMPKTVEVRPLYIMWKTTKFNDLIDRLGRSLNSLWRILWSMGIAISLGGMIYIFYSLSRNLFNLFFARSSATPVTLLIPGITLSLDINTLLFFGLAIAIVIVTHELAHGVAARAEGIKVKSTGLILLAIIPGAFVEPDEEDLKNARKTAQARVYAAGSTTNILVALLMLGLLLNFTAITSPFYQTASTGVQVTSVAAGSPAAGVLRAWDVITEVNGMPVNDSASLAAALLATTPNSTVPVTILRDGQESTIDFKVGYAASTNSSYMGVNTFNYYAPRNNSSSQLIPYYLYGAMAWTHLLSLNVGLVNMMPVAALDGDKLSNTVLLSLFRDENKAKAVSNVLRWSSLLILVLNVALSTVIFPSFRFG